MGIIIWAFTILFFTLTYTYLPVLFEAKLPPIVEGYFHPKFRKVAETIRNNVISGKERGMAFAVYHRGEVLVDMWAGYADVDAERPWSRDTITVPFSVTKLVAAITIARMVEKGWLEYDKPVATYWPEFAQHGKGEITVAQLLSHQAGLVSLGRKLSVFDVRDKRQELVRMLEQVEPSWTPGTAHGYHGITFGLYVDILAQKADPKHRNMTQLFHEELAVPFDVDFYMGVPKAEIYRLARGQYPSDFRNLLSSFVDFDSFTIFSHILLYPESVTAKALTVMDMKYSSMNNPEVVNIGISSFIGAGTARALAKLSNFLAMRGIVKGRLLLSPAIVNRLVTPVTSGQDMVLRFNNSFSPGLTHRANPHPAFKGQVLVGHPGYGGSVVYADLTNQLSVAYVTNFQSMYIKGDDPRYVDLETALYDCFKKYMPSKT